MRNEEAMFNLIENVALKDENVRAVVLNGSRANPEVKEDIFTDFDVVYFVKDFSEGKKTAYQQKFGDTLLVHTSDDMIYLPDPRTDVHMIQMLFDDRNRIDLSIKPLNAIDKHLSDEPIYKVLIDKDELIDTTRKAETSIYNVEKPSQALFNSCINTFLWLEPYVAKGLYRSEHIYAMKHIKLLRDALESMLEWKMGVKTNFQEIMGKEMKHLRYYLGEEVYKDYLKTYDAATIKKIWAVLFYMHDYFIKVAKQVAKALDYQYDFESADTMRNYLKEMRGLSMSQSEIHNNSEDVY